MTQVAKHGGKRSGAGRLPQSFHISKEAAKSLALLTSHKRGYTPAITELEVLETLIGQAWHELDTLYQEKAEEANPCKPQPPLVRRQAIVGRETSTAQADGTRYTDRRA